MRKIAFLTYDWNTEVNYQYEKGAEHFLKDHPDVVVHVYYGYGSYGISDPSRGAYQIFDLPDFSRYDAVVMQGNRVWKEANRQYVADKAHALGLPCVSINYPLKHCILAGSDNYGSYYKMVEHMIVHHHFTRLWHITGLPASKEAQERKQAFLDCVKKYGLTDCRCIEGEWEQSAGEDIAAGLVEEFKEKKDMPQAIVCGNDDVARGVEKVFLENGIRVPEDVALSGFDNLLLAQTAEVRISTVDRNYEQICYDALGTALAAAEGKDVHSTVYTIGKMIHSASCGCSDDLTNQEKISRRLMYVNDYLKKFYRLHDYMTEMLASSNSPAALMDAVEAGSKELEGGNFYLVLNGPYIENFHSREDVRHYGDRMYLAAAAGYNHPRSENDMYEVFDRCELLPAPFADESRLLNIYPLHVQETCIGYAVLEEVSPLMEFDFLQILLTLIENEIERMRQRNVVENLNDLLGKMYVRDRLTGLYNRFGLEKYGMDLYETLMKEQGNANVCFIDIDNMKQINDTYGHDAGDEALECTSFLIQKTVSGKEAFAMRYGGDEFVLIGEKKMKEALEKNLACMQVPSGRFDLSLSLGEIEVTADQDWNVHDAIHHADDLMYVIKKQKKMSH